MCRPVMVDEEENIVGLAANAHVRLKTREG